MSVLRHERFARSITTPPPPKRRRRIPRGVSQLKFVSRIKVGAMAEVVGSKVKGNNGLRVIVLRYEARDGWDYECKAISGCITDFEGGKGKTCWFKEKNLRRVWQGLTPDEVLRLKEWRTA